MKASYLALVGALYGTLTHAQDVKKNDNHEISTVLGTVPLENAGTIGGLGALHDSAPHLDSVLGRFGGMPPRDYETIDGINNAVIKKEEQSR